MPLLADKEIWANTNPTDPISGQPAIIVPSTPKQDSGFLRLERPPRQDFNWLHNQGTQWNAASHSALRGHIDGFHIIQSVGAPDNSYVDISQGVCVSENRQFLFDTFVDTGWPTTFMRKWLVKATVDTWVKGTDQPGITPSLSIGTGWWHCFVFTLADGDIDVAYDLDVSGANIKADFPGAAHIRRIFSIPVKSLDVVVGVKQMGDKFMYDNNGNEFTAISRTSVSTSPETIPVNGIPADVDTVGLFHVSMGADATLEPIGPIGGTDIGIAGAYQVFAPFANPILPSTEPIIGQMDIIQPGSYQAASLEITHNITQGTVSINVFALGWIDARGQDWGQGPAVNFPDRFWVTP